ncbi:unnamed protein product [Clavelina lepadiformis]|uniref:Dickkopf-related protein 1/2/4 C-terminal subdomain 1 domain-containing protein n=1 Tax=Clavelina lepadiformis TaxID=159417 RepID=A0ABP0EY60_CLALP
MLLSRFFLFGFVVLQYAQFELCESATKDSDVAGLLPINGSPARIRARLRGGHPRVSGHPTRKVICPSNKKKCRQKTTAQRAELNIRRPRKHRKQNRKSKKRRSCCKKLFKKCTRKRNKRCKKNDTCLIEFSRKCRAKYEKCKKGSNNRPRSCRRKSPNPSNQFPTVKSTLPTPATTPPAKKGRDDICTKPDDCEPGLCCARHKHVKLCKPLLNVDQVCTRVFPKKRRSADMYERCPCQSGLTCAQSELRHHTCQAVTPVT